MRGEVYQYKHAAAQLLETGVYTRGRTMYSRPVDGGGRGNVDVYMIIGGEVECVAHNITTHRSVVIINAYESGKIKNVHPDIVQNYITNGYNTRVGLYRANGKLARIQQVAKSHADYIGNETGDSSLDHERRMRMR